MDSVSMGVGGAQLHRLVGGAAARTAPAARCTRRPGPAARRRPRPGARRKRSWRRRGRRRTGNCPPPSTSTRRRPVEQAGPLRQGAVSSTASTGPASAVRSHSARSSSGTRTWSGVPQPGHPLDGAGEPAVGVAHAARPPAGWGRHRSPPPCRPGNRAAAGRAALGAVPGDGGQPGHTLAVRDLRGRAALLLGEQDESESRSPRRRRAVRRRTGGLPRLGVDSGAGGREPFVGRGRRM